MSFRPTKISLEMGSDRYTVERPNFSPREAFEDFLNMLFISGTDIEEIRDIIDSWTDQTKKNHKTNEPKADKGPCNL